MVSRCQNPKGRLWENYGGRGINVCERWQRKQEKAQGFWNFVADMGPRPEGYALGRRDLNGDYSPENCFWGDFVSQSINRRERRDGGGPRLAEQNVLDALEMKRAGCSVREIASKHSISLTHCYRILRGESWRKLTA